MVDAHGTARPSTYSVSSGLPPKIKLELQGTSADILYSLKWFIFFPKIRVY
jgi:hypothetical protein